MKQVTMESVKQRIAHIEDLNARGVGTKVQQQQFELSCLRELVAVTAQRDALVVEMAALKEVIMDITFMDDESFFGSTENAQIVMGRLVNIKTPATDAARASLRAEVLPQNIAEIIDSGELESILFASEASYSEEYRMAFYNFRQLRESKGEVQS